MNSSNFRLIFVMHISIRSGLPRTQSRSTANSRNWNKMQPLTPPCSKLRRTRTELNVNYRPKQQQISLKTKSSFKGKSNHRKKFGPRLMRSISRKRSRLTPLFKK